MSTFSFKDKSRDDLLDIVRLSGIMPLDKGVQMTHEELLDFFSKIETQMRNDGVNVLGIELPLRRRRGRPRKYPLPGEVSKNHHNTAVSSKDRGVPETGKRRRGRPRLDQTDKVVSKESPTLQGPAKQTISPQPEPLAIYTIEDPDGILDHISKTLTTPDILPENKTDNLNVKSIENPLIDIIKEQKLQPVATQDIELDPEIVAKVEAIDKILKTDPHREALAKRARRRGRPRKNQVPEVVEGGLQSHAVNVEEASADKVEISVQGEATNPQLDLDGSPTKDNQSKSVKSLITPSKHLTSVKTNDSDDNHPLTDSAKFDGRDTSVTGVLDILPEGYGFLRTENYLPGNRDAYVSAQFIRRFNLRPGDLVSGPTRSQKDGDRSNTLFYIKTINGTIPDRSFRRPKFDKLTPIYPNERYDLETRKSDLSNRIIDLVAPIGKGQRGMIVSPPKAGKTILLQKIANAISENNPEVKLIVLLIDERPEEVTDMQRSIKGEVVYSTFDRSPENHVRVSELVLERAMRLVELGEDVVILLDSITRLARAYNLTINPTGRTLSGGLDPGALYGPKRFFGAARNIEHGGSLTIVATSLIDTGSRMDEVIFEEFKGTGNMEVYLDRKLSEKRIFPAIDINRSGTRREELLLTKRELDAVWSIRKAFGQLDNANVTEMIINLLLRTNNNQQFVSSINVSFNDKSLYESMRMQKNSENNDNK